MGGTDAQFHRVVKGDATPREDGPCGVEHFFQIVRHPPPSCTAPGKVGDVLRGKSAVVNVAANAHHGSRIEHGVDAAFAVVAHDEPAKLKSAVDQTSLGMIVDLDLAIGVLEVAGVGVSAQVAPTADDGVAHKTIMSFVGESEEDAIGHFSADFAVGTDNGGAIDLRAHFDGGMFPEDEWASDVGAFLDLRTRPEIDGASCGVQRASGQRDARADQEIVSRPDDCHVVGTIDTRDSLPFARGIPAGHVNGLASLCEPIYGVVENLPRIGGLVDRGGLHAIGQLKKCFTVSLPIDISASTPRGFQHMERGDKSGGELNFEALDLVLRHFIC